MCSLQAIDDVFLSHSVQFLDLQHHGDSRAWSLGFGEGKLFIFFILALEKVNSLKKVSSSFFVFSVLDYFDDWSSENKRINTAP